MGKAGEHCKLPCLMDSGIQLSIQKFQTFKRDRIKWFSPQEVNTASQLCGAIIYVCWMWWNECLWEERRPTPTTPSSPGALCILQGTVQFPSAQKSKQKDSRASAYGSKHTAVTKIKCGFYNAKKKYKEESSYEPQTRKITVLTMSQLSLQTRLVTIVCFPSTFSKQIKIKN